MHSNEDILCILNFCEIENLYLKIRLRSEFILVVKMLIILINRANFCDMYICDMSVL
jgi:hypothetical protein